MEWEEDYAQPPDALSQIRAAQAADDKERRKREALAEIQRGLDMVMQRRTNVARPQAAPFDDNMKAFLLSRKAEQDDQRDVSDQPAPPEWGAIKGMTRKEALSAGYGKAPKAPEPGDDDAAPTEWHDRLRGLGIPNPEGISRKFAEKLLLADVNRQGQTEAVVAGEERRTEREAPDKNRDAAMKLRQEFQGQQVYKDTQAVATAYEKIQQAAPTGAGDIALVYGYMKLLDPGSTVREGEFATAANAGSVDERIIAWANKVRSGERLPDSVRQQFKKESLGVLRAQERRYNQLAEQYRKLAVGSKLNPGDVVTEIGLPSAAAGGAEGSVGVDEQPPVPGARRSKSGRWMVKGPKGWEYINAQ